MNKPKYESCDRYIQNYLDWEAGKCPDCNQAFLEYMVDDFDGHGYLLCPNIDCRAKIWVSEVEPDE